MTPTMLPDQWDENARLLVRTIFLFSCVASSKDHPIKLERYRED